MAQIKAYTVATLADHWGTSPTFVYNQIKAGLLQAFKLGGKLIRIKPEAVEEYECRSSLGASDASPENSRTAAPTGHSASSGQTKADRTASRLARQIERPRKLQHGTSGPVAHLQQPTP